MNKIQKQKGIKILKILEDAKDLKGEYFRCLSEKEMMNIEFYLKELLNAE